MSDDNDDLANRVRELIAKREPEGTTVLAALAAVPDNGGLTLKELAALTGQSEGHTSGAIKVLKETGMVISTGTLRITGTNVHAKVWKLAT